MAQLLTTLASAYRRTLRIFSAGAAVSAGSTIILDVPESPRIVKVDMHKVST